ncbi:Crp/Fnr family transcriptional regulator [Bacillus benzoevorans]|uniref:CRP/FNR family transcriptional regulator n=1 Tax=Bacillus benzoevorans TaxID=1456 RepID=A0A7X0LVX3_9BACI|nr:Crp/Fnr family transcriptional regulator [Bacillus benzoevorans]MBB6446083.1 CRP/FNR family transcriptional regulator [Bacillus benzoevorans]
MRMATIEQELKTVSIFNELEDEEIFRIDEIAQTRFYKEKMYVFMQGDPLDRLFFIQSGKVKIYKGDGSGREQIVSILDAGAMFPHAGFFQKGQVCPATAEVLEDAELIVIPISDFEKVLLSNPALCIKLFKVLGELIVDLQNRLEEQILHDTYERVVMLLLRLCKTNGVKHHDIYKITTHLTNRELASMIGTSRETFSRTVNDLKKKGCVAFDEKGYLMIDREVLKEMIL